MKKALLLIAIVTFAAGIAKAQLNYVVKDTTAPYVPLTGDTSLTDSLIWDEENLTASMPFTWTLNGNISVNKFNLALSFTSVLADTINLSNSNGFVLLDADIADRGILTGAAPLSPIRYATTGTAPNRIFKVELYNAGFYDEFANYNTMSDSFNMQVWVYETTNVVELHYGGSRITYPSDYFQFGSSGGPLVGYLNGVDFNNGTSGVIYNLSGNPGATTIDSLVLPPTAFGNSLTAWPDSGRVFRFTPKPYCPVPNAGFSIGTPTGNTVQYTYTGSPVALDSIVWFYGDGQQQTITNGFTAPVTHTFASSGHYNVCVVAFNSCGTDTSCQALALSIGNLPALGNVKVYPSPANSYLTIEGMQVGGRVSLLSMVGQQLLNIDIKGNKQTMDISMLPAGTYMLLLTDAKGVSASLKVTKQ